MILQNHYNTDNYSDILVKMLVIESWLSWTYLKMEKGSKEMYMQYAARYN